MSGLGVGLTLGDGERFKGAGNVKIGVREELGWWRKVNGRKKVKV